MSSAKSAQPVENGLNNSTDYSADNTVASEPSMDEILASIRKIISDQNDEADRAAEKAAADVANPQPATDNIDSIIGSIAANHFDEPGTAPKIVSAAEQGDESILGSITGEAGGNAGQLDIPVLQPPNRKTASFEDLIEPSPTIHQSRTSKLPDNPLNVSRETVRPVPHKNSDSGEANPPVDGLVEAVESIQRPTISHDTALERLLARRSGDEMPVSLPVVDRNDDLNIAQNVSAKEHRDARPGDVRLPDPIPNWPPSTQPYLGNIPSPNTRSMNEKPTYGNVVSNNRPETAAQQSSITSPSMNSIVSSSFERLAISMMEDRKEELDQMMTNLMRPILQDWLENNLPSLVERLVREEIEQVSRGVSR